MKKFIAALLAGLTLFTLVGFSLMMCLDVALG